VSVGLCRIDSDNVLDARGSGRHGGWSGIDDGDVGDEGELFGVFLDFKLMSDRFGSNFLTRLLPGRFDVVGEACWVIVLGTLKERKESWRELVSLAFAVNGGVGDADVAENEYEVARLDDVCRG
jgi:hypothetical protein